MIKLKQLKINKKYHSQNPLSRKVKNVYLKNIITILHSRLKGYIIFSTFSYTTIPLNIRFMIQKHFTIKNLINLNLWGKLV